MKDYLKYLSDKQFAAVSHQSGPALVLAGPGSGKTSVITARALLLIDSGIVTPHRLLTVTFSKAAAEEMRKRFIKLSSANGFDNTAVPEYGTLHSFCYRVLREYGFCKNYKVLNSDNIKYGILADIWNKVNNSDTGLLNVEYLELLSNTISKIKCFTGSNKEKELRKEIQIRNFDRIYDEYEVYKKENGYIDFDDMILKTAALLYENSCFCNKVSEEYDYIQIDEGQDMSFIQIEIVKAVGKHNNIFMVADDDQGIYGFRGADVKSVNLFEEAFKNCRRYYLEQNYRSVQSIVKTASCLVGINSMRYKKNLFTLNEKGDGIELLRTSCTEEQARFAAEIALANSAAGNTCGILYRSNISALMPLLYLYRLSRRKGIKAEQSAFSVTGGLFHPEKYEIVQSYCELSEKEFQKNGIFVKSPYEIYREMEKNGIVGRFRETSAIKGRREKDTEYILCFLKALSRLIGGREDTVEFFNTLKKDKHNGKISFSTVHSSKGLEYDCVIIIDATDDDFPKKTAAEQCDIEEERRLFYVAMTRAKKKLFILSPDMCGKIRCRPGLFFYETAKILNA